MTEIVVAILGQWASGKSTAAKTLINTLGGKNEVIFITDRELLARQAVNHILELGDSEVIEKIDDCGRRQLRGKYSLIYLEPGEDLESVDLNLLRFDLEEEVYKEMGPGEPNWLKRARFELGNQILERSSEGKPIVIEAGFGTNKNPEGDAAFSHTVSDLFTCLEEVGVDLSEVKWIIVEASYERRLERNNQRPDSVPTTEFKRFAAEGGGLGPEHQKRLEEQGTIIKRVPNNHDDVQKFRADIIAAFDDMFGAAFDRGTAEGKEGLL